MLHGRCRLRLLLRRRRDLVEPPVQMRLAEARAGFWNECPLTDPNSEIGCVFVGDDFAWVMIIREDPADRFVQPESVWPRDLHYTVQRLGQRRARNSGRDVVGRYRLE